MPISTLGSKRDMEQSGGRRRNQPWTTEEKKRLLDCVNRHEARNWKAIADDLGTERNAGSCRDLYERYLKPNIIRSKFTDEEILKILQLHRDLGPRWSEIAKWLPGRTDNDIKNFWNTQMKNEAKKLGCDVNREEFLYKMKELLRERIQAASDSTGDTSNNVLSSLDAILDGLPDQDCSDESFWATASPSGEPYPRHHRHFLAARSGNKTFLALMIRHICLVLHFGHKEPRGL